MKKLFNTKNITDTVVNMVVGGGANVAMDYAVGSYNSSESGAKSPIQPETVNYIKIGLGVVAGAMTGNKYLRMAADGMATVGASQLIAGLIAGTEDGGNGGEQGQSGIPANMVGAIRLGNGRFRRGARRLSGVAAAPDFMGK